MGSAKADTNGENILMASEQSGIAKLKHTKTFVINVQEGFDAHAKVKNMSFIPEEIRVVWWSSPYYGGLPVGAVYRSKGKIDTGEIQTDVALFQHEDMFYTIDLWTDQIIRKHPAPGAPLRAPTETLDSRTDNN